MRILPVLMLDAMITGAISFLAVGYAFGYAVPIGFGMYGLEGFAPGWDALIEILTLEGVGADIYLEFQWEGGGVPVPFGLFFYSAFFTSVWLWLYAGSFIVSRVLLRMNSGVGFLLRVTDAEHPSRSAARAS